MAASVLLNFANSVEFTPTDPLIGMVRTGARLLSYDLLSVGTFCRKDTERSGYIRKQVAALRNMLEERRLSSEDHGERIRLMILLDYIPWQFLKPDAVGKDDSFDAAFPTLKLEFVKSIVEEIFGKKNPLLRRLDYIIIYVDDNKDEERSMRYREASYHGFFTKFSREEWISKDVINVNSHRADVLAAMKNPDASMLLTDPSISGLYCGFSSKLEVVIEKIEDTLKKIGKVAAFEQLIDPLRKVKTVRDFQMMDYDRELKTAIMEAAGLGALRFRDSTYFIVNHRRFIKTQENKDNIALKSLIQLLSTMDDETYLSQFRPIGENDFHKLFILHDPETNDIQIDRLKQYRLDLTDFGVQLGGDGWSYPGGQLAGMTWNASREVSYFVYLPREVNAEGSHESQNETMRQGSRENERQFQRARRVPFFFGSGPGDWQWYHEVLRRFNECLAFEDSYDRLNIDSLTRMSDSEFPKEQVTSNFGELGTRIDSFTTTDIESSVDYDAYILARKEKLDELRGKAEDLKRSLVKLGFRSRFLWIAALSCLAFTGCYAYHFFTAGEAETPAWIGAGFLAACIAVILGVVISQGIVKEKINAVYREIDQIFESLRKIAKEHIESVNKLVREMNEADANRKTLSEMKVKYDQWKRHNKKVEIWVNYVRNMVLLLDSYLTDLEIRNTVQEESKEKNVWRINEVMLEGKPVVVEQIRTKDIYQDMKPKVEIANQNKVNDIEHVTSFIAHFTFDCVQK